MNELKLTSEIPNYPELARRQAELYAEAYRHCQPMPMGPQFDHVSEHVRGMIDGMARVGRAAHKTAIAMEWWRQYYGRPVLVNKLRGKDNPILELNDLIRPETLRKMAR